MAGTWATRAAHIFQLYLCTFHSQTACAKSVNYSCTASKLQENLNQTRKLLFFSNMHTSCVDSLLRLESPLAIVQDIRHGAKRFPPHTDTENRLLCRRVEILNICPYIGRGNVGMIEIKTSQANKGL